VEWLREWTAVDAADALATTLTSVGLEVESVTPAAPPFVNVVVATVASLEQHPNAEKLKVCQVDDGQGRHTVVCGAPNVAVGLKVPFARLGAELPGGQRIAAAELRGIASAGMLCSARELGLSDDAAGLLVLEPDAPLGVDVREYLRLDDAVLEINVTPNRGDCFSVLGIAREAAARSGAAVRRAEPPAVPAAHGDAFDVELNAGARCPRFAARIVHNIAPNRRSPLWLRERLRRAGLRAIHPIVDVTNYVMLELGQPLHAYDLAKVEGRLEARLANGGELLVLLDGTRIELADDVLVIADARGAVALAGIMGGESTAVDAATTDIVLESAYFAPQAVAGRARRYGLHTDASLRFERGVDPTGQVRAIERATELLAEICGGDAGPLTVVERAAELPKRSAIALRGARLRALLGSDIADAVIERTLRSLDMDVAGGGGEWRVTPPAFRFDVAIEEDLVEEVGRIVGYDDIPPTPGITPDRLGAAAESRVAPVRLADLLVARGYSEVITYSFVDAKIAADVVGSADAVALANPIASDMAVLRPSLWPGLIAAAAENLSHQRPRLKLFEIGRQFAADGTAVRETPVVAGLVLGARRPEHWEGQGAAVDFFDVKGDVETLLATTGRQDAIAFEAAEHPALSPGQTARLRMGEQTIGWIGALHPRLQQAHLDKKRGAIVFSLLVEAFTAEIPAFRAYSRFPSIRRDLALVVDEDTSAAAIVDAARAAAGERLQNVVLFDVYRGEGVDSSRKSIGLGLILQDISRTLTDADADETVAAVALRLERELGAKIRT
jgi:phenylalanyl-tRNA synthetase beta chain